ncbi:NlpC/P60 family protein [Endozoicomonas sp. ONNA2]|uniref:NlpC/P60 family protein n=1 Tax=Endozoicomonas sp. ONNA2 TaxID=2828741 RepID=UPI002148AAF7|nr:NlpC/P60 family protein [Endozoicomonas sp. ONNA2]
MNISNYIGRPWINDQQDCWTLVRDIYRDHLQIDLPAIAIDADNLRQVVKAFEDDKNLSPWQPIPTPEHLCLVFFTPGHHRATHCGLWLDVMGGRFLHCHRQAGVVFEDRVTLEQNGWCCPRFYRHSQVRSPLAQRR